MTRIFENRLDLILKRTRLQSGDSAAVFTTLLQITAPHLLLRTSAPGDVHVGMCSHQQMVFTVKLLNHSSATTHIQPTEKERECCLLNLGCLYKTLQSRSVPWFQNSRIIHASKIQKWDLHLGTWESPGTLVSKQSVPTLPKPVCSVRIRHLAPELQRVQERCPRHKVTHTAQKPQERRGSRSFIQNYIQSSSLFIVFVNCSTGGLGSRPSWNPLWAHPCVGFQFSSSSLEMAVTTESANNSHARTTSAWLRTEGSYLSYNSK